MFQSHVLKRALTRRMPAVCAAALAMLCAIAAPQASANDNTHDSHDNDRVLPLPAPAAIQPPAGNRAFLVAHAAGTQNYMCLPVLTSPGLAWVAIGPQATLFNEDDDQQLTHFLSPNPFEGGIARATWQHSRDTSAAWALAIASSTDPRYVTPGAIPWLLLRVTGAQEGPDGRGRMADTTFVQRVNTVGGAAPVTQCVDIGSRVFVPYEADYVFYKVRGRGDDRDDRDHDRNHDRE